jgi:hypothetical protein
MLGEESPEVTYTFSKKNYEPLLKNERMEPFLYSFDITQKYNY